MSQENKDKADAAEARTQQTKGFMQQVRVVARRKYTPEEKVVPGRVIEVDFTTSRILVEKHCTIDTEN